MHEIGLLKIKARKRVVGNTTAQKYGEKRGNTDGCHRHQLHDESVGVIAVAVKPLPLFA